MKFNSPPAKSTSLVPVVQQQQRGLMVRAKDAFNAFFDNGWFGPGQPVAPAAQEAAFGRLNDYPVGVNMSFTPRSSEPISFAQLRALADNNDLVRLAIETRKDQITKVKWQITHKDPRKDMSLEGEDKERLLRVQAMLERPDGRNGWRVWLRELIEEVMVTDALAIFPRKNVGGQNIGFELMDGATISPLSDPQGRVPEYPQPAYQQIIKGMPAVNYTVKDLMYCPRNTRVWKFYGYSPVEQIAFTVNMAIRRAVNQLEYFTEGNIPEAFASLPIEWSGTEIAAFQTYWDATMEGQQQFKRKMRFVPGGTKIEQTKAAILTDGFDEWLARIICYAFSLPPTQFVKQTTRVTGDVLQEAAEKEGLAPLMAWLKDLLDVFVQDFMGEKDLQFSWIEEDAMDPQSEAKILETYVKNSIMTINEARQKLGMHPIENGDEPMIYTVAGAVALKFAILEPAPGATPGDPATPPTDPTNGTHRAPGKPAATLAPGKPMRPPTGVKGVTQALQVSDLTKGAFRNVLAVSDNEKRLTASFAKTLESVGASVADQLVNGIVEKVDEPQLPYMTEAQAIAFAKAVDLAGFSLVWDDYNEVLYITTDDGVQTALARVVAGGSTSDVMQLIGVRDPNAVIWATKHAAELLSKDGRAGELVEATRDMIRDTLVRGIADGLTRDQLADVLRNMYGFSAQRAELIAVTEIRTAEGYGLLFGYKAAGMEYKKWLLSSLEGICPSCEANAAQGYIPIDKAFASGAEAPLQHPNCRCDIVASNNPET